MKAKIRSILLACTFMLSLAGCSEDDGVSSSGSGTGDGGASSAQFAGTYNGTIDVSYKGDGVDGSDSFPVVMVINNNGTVSMTVAGDSVSGVINGNKIDITFRITQSEDGVTCTGDARVTATVSGASLTGPVSGSAECKLLLLKRNAILSGSISASKI
jgi:hypothetical protein